MTVLVWLMAFALVCCAGALLMTVLNVRLYCQTGATDPAPEAGILPRVLVCVPARNEETNLGPCVRSLLNSTGVDLTVLVYEDHSTDATASVLAALCTADARVMAVPVLPLPPGWNGKQFACEQMGRFAASLDARAPVSDSDAGSAWLLFTDADVRFEPECLAFAARRAAELNTDLLSTFPRQITGSLAETLAVPMIHFVLFSYLPMSRMRRTNDPRASAGCGQFLLVRRAAWAQAGGHATFADSMHDGIRLPRAVRAAGLRTDLFDATRLCSVRMYRGLGQTWRGFAKNAYEGLGSPVLLVAMTVIHLIAHVLPPGVVVWSAYGSEDEPSVVLALCAALAGSAWVCAIVQRGILARRFALPAETVVLHPVAVVFMTIIQWWSFALHVTGRRQWRGRGASPAGSSAAAR